MLKLLLAFALMSGLASPVSPEARYAEGQVWEYRTRPGEEGSLLKIQHIEAAPAGAGEQIYHISIIGVRLGGQTEAMPIQHLPVSRETLDASVTRLSNSRPEFPSADEGIAEWRRAQGGVFTITIAEIVAVVDRSVSGP